MKILVLGINGFIGSHLTEAVLKNTDWEIGGFDLRDDNIRELTENSRLDFYQGDIFTEDKWLEQQVEKCDVVLPLAGIAKPAYYLKKPIWTFELDFEQNLKIVRMCAKHGTRIVFPSTSEVYGLSSDKALTEDESPLVTGPIKKTRWIYSCSKQMMDRMIFAYGQEQNLQFSIFRPFNWVGPRLDTFADAEARAARSVTQMVYDILNRGTVSVVDGGAQRRSFTWIGDAIDGLTAIIGNSGGEGNGEIFNIGNPSNNNSIRELAEIIIEEMKNFAQFRERAERAVIHDVAAREYYGGNYQDMENRIPSVEKMAKRFGWKPTTGMRETVAKTLSWYARKDI